MTPNCALKIERLKLLHRTAATTQNYAQWLDAVRGILAKLPELLDDIEKTTPKQ
jgi:hypothetical protein